MSYQRSIRGWFNMINNSTPAETKIKTPPTPAIEEKLDEIFSQNIPNLAKKIELKLPELKLPTL